MKEQLIDFETAKLAKEKGFNEDVKDYYSGDGEIFTKLYKAYKGKYYQVPTQSLLQKWLREKHEIHITLDPGRDGDSYRFNLWNKLSGNNGLVYNKLICDVPAVQSYEQALEKGLIEALKLIQLK